MRSRRYRYAAVLTQGETPVAVRVIQTEKDLELLLDEAGFLGYSVLFHPNPVRVSRKLLRKLNRAGRKPRDNTLEIARKAKILSEEGIAFLQNLVLDLDSPFRESLAAWEEIVEEAGIPKNACSVLETASGNMRVWIHLAIGRDKRFLTAWAKGPNKKPHIENAKEALDILCTALRKKGIKADTSFVSRVNHPVWLEGFRNPKGVSRLVSHGNGSIPLYTLYKRTKTLQRRKGFWKLSRRYWGNGNTGVRTGKIEIPVRTTNPTEYLFKRWVRSVTSLVRKHDSDRFLRVINPAIGWAKYLGLQREAVDATLRKLLPDKKNLEKDLRTAWAWSDPLEFTLTDGRTYRKLVAHTKRRILLYLQRKGRTPRQVLLQKVCKGNVRLLQNAENELLKESLVIREKEKLTPGPGRASWVYRLNKKKHGTEQKNFPKKNHILTPLWGAGDRMPGSGGRFRVCPLSSVLPSSLLASVFVFLSPVISSAPTAFTAPAPGSAASAAFCSGAAPGVGVMSGKAPVTCSGVVREVASCVLRTEAFLSRSGRCGSLLGVEEVFYIPTLLLSLSFLSSFPPGEDRQRCASFVSPERKPSFRTRG